MKIAQISKADASGGGASRVAEELNRLLGEQGQDSKHWVSYLAKGRRPDGHTRLLCGPIASSCLRIARRIAHRSGLHDLIPFTAPLIYLNRKILKSDILHFHDISYTLSPQTLARLSRRIPVTWTFHDYSPFTAGCLYPVNCSAPPGPCGDCPEISHWPLGSRIDLTRFLAEFRRTVLRNSNIHVVCPSVYIARQAMATGALLAEPTIIYNGVDTKLFRQRNRPELKKKLGMNPDIPLVLLSAGDLNNRFKGYVPLLTSLQAANLECNYLAIGELKDPAPFRGLRVKFTGYITDRAQQAEYFSAADVFAYPSLYDNFPLIVLEALASGLPVVSFATGGIPEAVVSGKNGILCKTGDYRELVKAVEACFVPSMNQALSMHARQVAEARFSHDRFIDDHLRLYASILRN